MQNMKDMGSSAPDIVHACHIAMPLLANISV